MNEALRYQIELLGQAWDKLDGEPLELRRCPVCGFVKHDDDYWACSGPHLGPFPTERSHKFTPTEVLHCVVVDVERQPLGENPGARQHTTAALVQTPEEVEGGGSGAL